MALTNDQVDTCSTPPSDKTLAIEKSIYAYVVFLDTHNSQYKQWQAEKLVLGDKVTSITVTQDEYAAGRSDLCKFGNEPGDCGNFLQMSCAKQ